MPTSRLICCPFCQNPQATSSPLSGAAANGSGCALLMFVDSGQEPLMEECEAVLVRVERGRGGRSSSAEGCAVGKGDGFIS